MRRMDATNGTTSGERVRARYRAALARGELQPDPAQAGLVARLAALADALDGYAPPVSRARWRARWRSRASRPAPPSGLYIHGPVGRGKSMLMDLFFGAITIPAKRRVHFHAFMVEVHARLHAQRRDGAAQEPLAALADRLIERARLLCFDEFQVQNIADAMILGRLFEALFERGLVVVATSNFAPERLYEGGLNRERFVRFVELLRERVAVVPLAGATDYRLERPRDVATYHQPLGPATDAKLDQAFAALTDAAAGAPEVIEVASRRLEVPKAAKSVAWFDFQALCEEPLGAADYLALTERYHTMLLSGVPRLTPDKRNQARRFITLVDALYDRRVNLIIGAAAAPDELYPAGDGAFEFQRTVSRLMEMQSRAYFESAPVAGVATASFTPFALTTDIV
jgi:cell division protein ZapE